MDLDVIDVLKLDAVFEGKSQGIACQVLVDEEYTDIDEGGGLGDNEDVSVDSASDDISSERAEPFPAVCRAEVNLDVIANKFRDGELVDLSALKRKRLVSRRTDYVKILARGALTKPLIVEAQDFSRAAEDMLRAVGGEAIRVGIDKKQ